MKPGDDTDTVTAVTGGLAGLYYGYDIRHTYQGDGSVESV